MEITVNGKRRHVDAPGETPLLWVLRDELRLTGTKYGCGVGLCGACTVLMDGAVARSCTVSVQQATGVEITTIEGISEDGGHPVQRAWVEEDVPQCGYCHAGQIMAALALLSDHPKPNDDQIAGAMGPILCRCGTYPRIRRAIHRAAKLGEEG